VAFGGIYSYKKKGSSPMREMIAEYDADGTLVGFRFFNEGLPDEKPRYPPTLTFREMARCVLRESSHPGPGRYPLAYPAKTAVGVLSRSPQRPPLPGVRKTPKSKPKRAKTSTVRKVPRR